MSDCNNSEIISRNIQNEIFNIFYNAPIIIVLLDGERRVRGANRSTLEVTGRPLEELLDLRNGDAFRCLYSLEKPEGCGFSTSCNSCVTRRLVVDTFKTGKTHYRIESDFLFQSRKEPVRKTFLISTVPVNISNEKMVLVFYEDISDQKRLEVELKKRVEELSTSRNALKKQLEIAAQVHQTLLPKPVVHESILVDVRYFPMGEVGGDYCQVLFPDKNLCYITACDVTGHGVGPAILATRISSEVRRFVLDKLHPLEIVASLNNFIWDYFESTNLYPTFFASRIDFKKRTITWSGAGHPSPLLIRFKDRVVERLQSQNPMIGIRKDVLSEKPESTISFELGDRLIFYSDGLSEVFDKKGKILGVTGLAQIARATMSEDLFKMADYIFDRVKQYSGEQKNDDELLIVTEFK